MATPSLEWYKTSVLANMWDASSNEKMLAETPWFNVFSNNTPSQASSSVNTPYLSDDLDREVEVWLWVSIPYQMSNREKQDYVNNLSNAQYRQMKKLKDQWYSFEASRAIVENADRLVNPTALWKQKYMPKETFGEKVEDFGVWVLQSPWKRGYNIIWQWIDRAWKALADKLQWTELANFIQQSAIDLFWEDEVRAFAEQRQRELAEWTAFNGREQTDIRTPLLWEQRADSKYTRAWEVVWDLATAIAMSYPLGMAGAPAYTNSTLLWKTLLGSAEGVLDMAMYDYWSTWEAPTTWSLVMWGVLWAASPILWAVTKSVSKATREGAINLGEKILQNTNRMTKAKQAEFVQKYWFSVGKWLNDRWLRTGEDIVDYFTRSKNKVDEALWAIKWRFTWQPLDDVLDDVVEFAQKTKNPQTNRLIELAKKNKEWWLTMSEINEVKRFFEANNKFYYKYWETASVESRARATNLDTELRNWQRQLAEENWFTNLAELNKETAAAKHILDANKKWADGIVWNNPVSLTDFIVAFNWGNVSVQSLGALFTKKVLEQPWVRSKLVDMLNRVGRHQNVTEKMADMERIFKINEIKDQKALEKYVDDLYKEWGVGNTTPKLPENITQWWVAAWDRGIVTTNPTAPTYEEMWLGELEANRLADAAERNWEKTAKPAQ